MGSREDITDPPLIHSWMEDALSGFAEELHELGQLAEEEELEYRKALEKIREAGEVERFGSMSGRNGSNRAGPKRGKAFQQDEAAVAAAERERVLQERLDTLNRGRERAPYRTMCHSYESELKVAQLSVEPVKQRERKELDFFRSHHTEYFTMDDILEGSRFPIPKIKPPIAQLPHAGTGTTTPSTGSCRLGGKAGGPSSPRKADRSAKASSPRRESRSTSASGLGGSKKHVTLDGATLGSSRRNVLGDRTDSPEYAAAAAANAIASTPPFIIDALAFAKQHNQTLKEEYGYKPVLTAESGLVDSPPPEEAETLVEKLKTHKPGIDTTLAPFFLATYPPTDHLPEAPSEFASNVPMTVKEFRKERQSSRSSEDDSSSGSNTPAKKPPRRRSPVSNGGNHTAAALPKKKKKAAAAGGGGGGEGRQFGSPQLHLGIECSAPNRAISLRACTNDRATAMVRFTNRNADRHRLRIHPPTDPWLTYTCTCMAPVAGRVERHVRYEMPVSCGGYIEVEVQFQPEHMFEPIIDTTLQIGVTKERNARNAEGATWEFYDVHVHCETILPQLQLYSVEGNSSASLNCPSSTTSGAISVPPLPETEAAPRSASKRSGGGGGPSWMVDVSSVAVSSALPSAGARSVGSRNVSVSRSILSRPSLKERGASARTKSSSSRSNSKAREVRLFPIDQIEFEHTFVMATTTATCYMENIGSDAMLTLKSDSTSFRILPHAGGVRLPDDGADSPQQTGQDGMRSDSTTSSPKRRPQETTRAGGRPDPLETPSGILPPSSCDSPIRWKGSPPNHSSSDPLSVRRDGRPPRGTSNTAQLQPPVGASDSRSDVELLHPQGCDASTPFTLQQFEGTMFTISFQPREEGVMRARLEITVQEARGGDVVARHYYDLVGAGVVPRLQLTRLGEMDVEESGSPQWWVDNETETVPHYFVEDTTPNVSSKVVVEVRNHSLVPLPFHWCVEANRTLVKPYLLEDKDGLVEDGDIIGGDGEEDAAGESVSSSDSGSSTAEERRRRPRQVAPLLREPDVSIEPHSGVLEAGSVSYFTVSVTPHRPVPLVTSYSLFIEGLPDPDDPLADPHTRKMWSGVDASISGLFRRDKLIPSARLCHGTPSDVMASISAKLQRGHPREESTTDTYADAFASVRRLIAPQDTVVEQDTFAAGFFVFLQPLVPVAVMVPQCFTETLDCLINYENSRRATLHNRSPRPLHFYFDPTPEECGGCWPPHNKSRVSMRVIPRAGVVAPFSSQPVTMKFTVHHIGEHHESINLYIPEIMELSSPGAPCSHTVQLDVVGVGASVHTSTGMLDFGLIELGKEAHASFTVTNDNPVMVQVDLQDPMMREPPRFVFIPPTFQLCPGDSIEVTVYRKAVSKEDAQTFFELVVRNGGTIAMETRATIQDSTLVLDGAVLQFGPVPEGVWQESEFYVSNLTAFDNPFTLKLASPPNPFVQLDFDRHRTIRAGQRHCGIKVRARYTYDPREESLGVAETYRALLGLRSQRNQQVLLVEVLCETVHQLTMSVDMAPIRTSTSVQAMTTALQHFLPFQPPSGGLISGGATTTNPGVLCVKSEASGKQGSRNKNYNEDTELVVSNAVMVRGARWKSTIAEDYVRGLLWNLIDFVVLERVREPEDLAPPEESEGDTDPVVGKHKKHRKKKGSHEGDATAPTETQPSASGKKLCGIQKPHAEADAAQPHALRLSDGAEGTTGGLSSSSLARNGAAAAEVRPGTGGSTRALSKTSGTSRPPMLDGVPQNSMASGALVVPRPYHPLSAPLCLHSQLASDWPVCFTNFALAFQNYTGCVSAYRVEVLRFKEWEYVLETFLAPDGGGNNSTQMSGGGLTLTQQSMSVTSHGSPAVDSVALSAAIPGSPAGGVAALQAMLHGRRARSPLRLTDGSNSCVPLVKGENPSFWTTLINGVEARERANKVALAGAEKRLLDGRGCSTLQCAPYGPVLPFDRIQLPMMMISNLPGRYEEQIRVHFDSLRPPMDLPVTWEVEGKPILLDPTTSGLTTCGHHDLLLMPSVIASVGASRRHLRLINRIPRDINVEVSIYLCSTTFQVAAEDDSADASSVVLRLMPLSGEAKQKQSVGKGNATVSPAKFFMRANSTKEIWLEYEPDLQVVQPVLERLRGAADCFGLQSTATRGVGVPTTPPARSPSGSVGGSSVGKTGGTDGGEVTRGYSCGGAGERAEPTTASQEVPWDGSVVIHAEIAESVFNDSFLIDEFYERHKERYPSIRSLEGLRAGIASATGSGVSTKSILSRVSMLQVRRPLRSRRYVIRKNRVLFPSPSERYVLERAMLANGSRLCNKLHFTCNRFSRGNTDATHHTVAANASAGSGGAVALFHMSNGTDPVAENAVERMEEILRASPGILEGSMRGPLSPTEGARGGSTPPMSSQLAVRKKQKTKAAGGEPSLPEEESGSEEEENPDSSEEEVDDSVAMLEAMAGGMRPLQELLCEEEERRELLFFLLRRRGEVRKMSHKYFNPIELLVRARCGVPSLDIQPSMEGVFFPVYHHGRWCGRTVRLTNYNSAPVFLALEVDAEFRIASLNLIPSQVESDPLKEEDEPDIMEGFGGSAASNRGRHRRPPPPEGGYPLGNNELRQQGGSSHRPFPFATAELDGRLVYRLQCGDALNVTIEVRDPEKQAAMTDPLHRKRVVLQGRLMAYFYDGSTRSKRGMHAEEDMGEDPNQPTSSSGRGKEYGFRAVGSSPPRSVCTQEAKKNRIHNDSPMPLALQMPNGLPNTNHSNKYHAATATTTTTTTMTMSNTNPSLLPLDHTVQLSRAASRSPISVPTTPGGGPRTPPSRGQKSASPALEMGRRNALAQQQVPLFVSFCTPAVLTAPLVTWFQPGQLVHDGRPQPDAIQRVTCYNLSDEPVRFRVLHVPRAQALQDDFAKPVLPYITSFGVQGSAAHLTFERRMQEVMKMPEQRRPAAGDNACFLVDEAKAFCFSQMEGIIPPATMGGMPGTTTLAIHFEPHSTVRYECFFRLLIDEKLSDNFFLVRGDSRETEV